MHPSNLSPPIRLGLVLAGAVTFFANLSHFVLLPLHERDAWQGPKRDSIARSRQSGTPRRSPDEETISEFVNVSSHREGLSAVDGMNP